MVKVAYTVGRFQPPTIGHRMMIEKTIAEAGPGGEAYVFVSSTQGKDLKKNPLTSKQKLPLLKKMFPSDVTFVDTADCTPKCGGPRAAFEWLLRNGKKPEEISFVIGKERLDEDNKDSKDYFGPEAALWGKEGSLKPTSFVPVGNLAIRRMETPADDAANMSGTKARSYVTKGEKDNFYKAVGFVYNPSKPDPVVESVYSSISKVMLKGGEEEQVEEELPPMILGPDGEPGSGAGRRKTRRFRRSKASSKALYRRGSRSRNGSSKTSRS